MKDPGDLGQEGQGLRGGRRLRRAFAPAIQPRGRRGRRAEPRQRRPAPRRRPPRRVCRHRRDEDRTEARRLPDRGGGRPRGGVGTAGTRQAALRRGPPPGTPARRSPPRPLPPGRPHEPPGKARVSAGYLALFATLYAIQGVVVAYFFNFNALYMKGANPPVPDETIGWVQTLATVPLMIKFLGGPISDRFSLLGMGHRKPYIVLGLLVQALGLLALSKVDPGRHLAGFAAAGLFTVLGLALYDTCCDGLILDVTPPADRQRVQGTLVASRFLATMACSWGFGHWLARVGNGPGRGDGVLWACAGLTLIPLVLALAGPRAGPRPRRRGVPLGGPGRPDAAPSPGPPGLRGAVFGRLLRRRDQPEPLLPIPEVRRRPGGRLRLDALPRQGRGAALAAARRDRGSGRRGVLLGGVLALAATTAGQVARRRADLGGGVGVRVRHGQRLARRDLLRPGDGGVGPEAGGLDVSPCSWPSPTSARPAAASSRRRVSAFGGRYRPVFLLAAAVALPCLALTRTLARPDPKSEPPDDLAE